MSDMDRPYVSWCPNCGEWCDFDEQGLAESLTENHNEHHHNGEPVSYVRTNRGFER